ncbi:MAG: tryptophan--tRNA ligase [Betaproteobacteria bacterium]|nr:tryptophan--tRNA ligase [Betaproteobacteria bacterium]
MADALKRTVSGMRPTGPLHIGHYFGVLKNWINMQEQDACYYFVADWHALTSDYAAPEHIHTHSAELVKDWLAAGLDPKKCVIFQQSEIKAHAELTLLLGMVTPISWLERNPTYKEQRQEISDKDLGNFGFLGYPVLMAADILLYQPDFVPVGQDQLPHLELTREIARRFNHLYGDFFPEPAARLTHAPKCPGLDGRKMSKSYGNAISLNDSDENIAPKIRGMFTDKNRLRKSDPGNPDSCNLFPYHQLLSDEERQVEIRLGCTSSTLGCVDCKRFFMEKLVAFLEPLRTRRAVLDSNPDLVQEVLREGNTKARAFAESTMTEVRRRMGV